MMRENWQMTVHLVLKSEYETQKHLMFEIAANRNNYWLDNETQRHNETEKF